MRIILTVIFGGNVALGGNVRSWLRADKAYNPLAGLGPVLDGADLRMASLISPISDKSGATGKLVTPVGPPKAADALARAGLGALVVANDEIFSSGMGAFVDTLANLTRNTNIRGRRKQGRSHRRRADGARSLHKAGRSRSLP